MSGLMRAVVSLALLHCGVAVSAAEPLHVQIDQLIAAKFDGRTPAPPADDAEFLRRVHLDLAGTIPTADDVRRFLADQSPGKRQQQIDALLAAPTYVQRMENLFHVVLMERRGDHPEWRRFLRTSFEQNKPWNQLVREILAPDDSSEDLRGAAFFHTKRLEKSGQQITDWSGLTRDVGRLFLGVDLQCAECHNHLFVDDYKQVDFQGLYSVYRNLTIRGGKFPAIKQTQMKAPLEFVSVFDPTQRATGPRVPFGKEFPLPEMAESEDDGKKAKGKKNGEPTWDPLTLIAEELPTERNQLFTRNIVNRLWYAMMGRGLVMPLDLFHSDNPASHPELLDLLEREFIAHQFDLKWLLRELALTQTYQRSSRIPEGYESAPPAESYLVALEKRLSSEQLLDAMLQATGCTALLPATDAEGKPAKEYAALYKQFLAAFANEKAEPEVEFNASVKGALFLLNDDDVLALLRPQEGNLASRLVAMDDNAKLTEELFLQVLGRLPDAEEQKAAVTHLERDASRRAVMVEHLMWGMLSSIEFCVNH